MVNPMWSTPAAQGRNNATGQSVRGGTSTRDNRTKEEQAAQDGGEMPELIQSLLAQKMAGAELTGMDAQLMRAAKLRDKEYNPKGEYTMGGIGAAMGGMANYLDRSRGEKEHGQLTREMDVARKKIAEGEAMGLARTMGQEDRSEGRLTDKITQDQENWQATFDQKERLARAAAAAKVAKDTKGSEYGELGTKDYGDLEQAAGSLKDLTELRNRGAADPRLYNQVTGPLGAFEIAQSIGGKLAERAPGLHSMVAGEAGTLAAQKAKDFQDNRELVYEGVLRYLRAGGAVPAQEMAKIESAVSISPAEDPVSAQKGMDYLLDWHERVVLDQVQKSNLSKGQYNTLMESLTVTKDRNTGEASQGLYSMSDRGDLVRTTPRESSWKEPVTGGGFGESAPLETPVKHTRESLEALRKSDPEEFARVIGG